MATDRDVTVDAEVAIEVDRDELGVEADDVTGMEAEFEENGIGIAVEVEVEVDDSDGKFDEGGTADTPDGKEHGETDAVREEGPEYEDFE